MIGLNLQSTPLKLFKVEKDDFWDVDVEPVALGEDFTCLKQKILFMLLLYKER